MEQGEMYGDFKILEANLRNRIKVECMCGYVGFRRASHLETGRTTSCKSCASKKTAKKYGMPSNLEAVGDLGKTYFSCLRRGAEKRDLSFNVTQGYLWSIFDGKCKLTGLSINLSLETHNCAPKYSSFTASLDRIDSSIGYEPDNVQWVHKDFNRLKNNYSQEDFISMCRAVATYANQQPS